jgi:Flp pilus assembly protein TadD
LKAGHFDGAVTEFRSALLYSPDDYSYQLNLAEALIGMKRTAEASTYLLTLWERQPDDGLVNLELARIAAQKERTDQAQRYYHNAIYATWPDDAEGKRRDARLELIEFLLQNNARAQAEPELIALAENIGDDAAQQRQVGDLFVRTLDYERAFAFYRLSLRLDRHNQAALAGAGSAAFQLGRYPEARRYLQSAVAGNSDDAESAALLKTTELVLAMDPFQRQISMTERNRIVIEAFAVAGERIKACAEKSSGTTKPGQPNLAENWAKMKSRVTESQLRSNPDLVESAMDMVFDVERETSVNCGAPVGKDLALLLIAKLHEGN